MKTAGLGFAGRGKPTSFFFFGFQVFDGTLATPVAFDSPQFFYLRHCRGAAGHYSVVAAILRLLRVFPQGNVTRFSHTNPSKADGNTHLDDNAENGHGNKTPAVVKIGMAGIQ